MPSNNPCPTCAEKSAWGCPVHAPKHMEAGKRPIEDDAVFTKGDDYPTGHASIDMTAHYTLRDQAIQEKAIRKHQRAVMDLSQIEPRKRKPPVVEISKTLKRKEKVVGLTELESVTSTVSR